MAQEIYNFNIKLPKINSGKDSNVIKKFANLHEFNKIFAIHNSNLPGIDRNLIFKEVVKVQPNLINLVYYDAISDSIKYLNGKDINFKINNNKANNSIKINDKINDKEKNIDLKINNEVIELLVSNIDGDLRKLKILEDIYIKDKSLLIKENIPFLFQKKIINKEKKNKNNKINNPHWGCGKL